MRSEGKSLIFQNPCVEVELLIHRSIVQFKVKGQLFIGPL